MTWRAEVNLSENCAEYRQKSMRMLEILLTMWNVRLGRKVWQVIVSNSPFEKPRYIRHLSKMGQKSANFSALKSQEWSNKIISACTTTKWTALIAIAPKRRMPYASVLITETGWNHRMKFIPHSQNERMYSIPKKIYHSIHTRQQQRVQTKEDLPRRHG